MLCIAAAIIFGVLSIFSAKYRPLAKESFKCVFRLLTLKKCEASIEERVRTKITSKLLLHSPSLAKFIYKNFSLLSLVFVIIFFVSLTYTIYSVYNLFVWGSCNPGGTCAVTTGACAA